MEALADIPLNVLRAELDRRLLTSRQHGVNTSSDDSSERPACGSTTKPGSYNTPLHVGALVLILVLSTFACSFPIIARRFPRLPIPRHFLFLSRHFGTGVLIATAFIHLLPTAFISLTNPCLPPFWNKGYPATAGLVSMIAVMIVVTIEMFFALRGAKHVHGTEYDTLIENFGTDSAAQGEDQPFRTNGAGMQPVRLTKVRTGDRLHADYEHGGSSTENLVEGASPMFPDSPPRRRSNDDDDDDDLDLEELHPFPDGSSAHSVSHGAHRQHFDHSHYDTDQSKFTTHQQAQKQLLQCLLLEAGILFHSVFIGMALSVATGTSFIVLLVAISFHQTFEGFALGSRIASLIPALFPASSPKPWLMALAYGTTTPLGQAIGLGLHNLYDPASTAGLLMVGLTNAFSSGLLLFAGLVELLAEDFLSDKSYEVLKGRHRVEACLAVFGGAMLMALVGAFA